MRTRTDTLTRTWMLAGAAALALACGSDNGPGHDGDGGDGGGGGGAVGAVIVGNLFFESAHNGTRNPALDTVPVGQTVTWTLRNTGQTAHTVTSDGSQSFTSSNNLTGSGTVHTATFDAAGTYTYHCSIHPTTMTGTVVVQ